MNAAVDISNVILETERLILRPWKGSDLQDFYEYASVDGVGQMAGWPPHENIEVSKKVLDSFIKGKKTFALVDKSSGKVIGSLGLEEAERQEQDERVRDKKGREFGYVLSKDYWGRGLMPEAVKRAIQYAFDEEGWDFILCGHFHDNNQSRRVIEKCGFEFYKNFRLESGQEGRLYILERNERYADLYICGKREI